MRRQIKAASPIRCICELHREIYTLINSLIGVSIEVIDTSHPYFGKTGSVSYVLCSDVQVYVVFQGSAGPSAEVLLQVPLSCVSQIQLPNSSPDSDNPSIH